MPRLDDRLSVVERLSERVSAADTVAAAIFDICSTYDLAHVTYHLVHTFSDDADSPYVRTTYPLEWVGEYVLRRYVDKDRNIRAGTSRVAPFDWDSLSGDLYYSEVMDAAEIFGIGRSGYSVPIVDKRLRRALISFNSQRRGSEWQTYVALHGKDWIELAYQVHRKAVYEAYGQGDTMPRLAPRELECLTWTARVGPVGDIAAAKDTTAAGNALLPQNPLVGSAGETADATRRLAAQDPETTTGIVRQNLDDRYAKASTVTQEGNREFAGAKFAKDIAGNEQRRSTLDAVLGSLLSLLFGSFMR